MSTHSSALTATFLRDTRHGGDPGQPAAVAAALAAFVAAATSTVDIAIYDFRLSPALARPVVGALVAAAERGVAVRIGYDAGKPAAGGNAADLAAEWAALQADPAPQGTGDFVTVAFAGTKVAVAAIAAAPQLMHDKYVVRDAALPSGTVWTGSVNFTDDAWTLQESNILVIGDPVVAAAFAADFAQLWKLRTIVGTGAGDAPMVPGATVHADFSPGDGRAIDAELVTLIHAARQRVVIAAMVLTSHTVLAALVAAAKRGVTLSGIYDSGQMGPIVAAWRKVPADAAVLADFTAVAAHLSAKRSAPYTPTSLHDFMHNKVMVIDDTVVTGSYNFSANAQRNAENQLRCVSAPLAASYATAIATIAAEYAGPKGHQTGS